jgi:hypothetical protein
MLSITKTETRETAYLESGERGTYWEGSAGRRTATPYSAGQWAMEQQQQQQEKHRCQW